MKKYTQNETKQTHQSLGTTGVGHSEFGMETENFFCCMVTIIIFHDSSLWNVSLPRVHCCLNSALYPYGLAPSRDLESVAELKNDISYFYVALHYM